MAKTNKPSSQTRIIAIFRITIRLVRQFCHFQGKVRPPKIRVKESFEPRV
jgi:hypothetical protein